MCWVVIVGGVLQTNSTQKYRFNNRRNGFVTDNRSVAYEPDSQYDLLLLGVV